MDRLRPSRRRVTSADVAREAGLSRTTVSYVLNGTPHQSLPESTRRRVVDAASRLGYAPSAAARTLRSGRSDVVLCMLPDWPIGVMLGRLLESLSAELDSLGGLTLLTHPAVGKDLRISHVLRGVTPDAVISFQPLDATELAMVDAAGVPVTMIVSDKAGGNRIRGIDQRAIGRLQVKHLMAAGHRTLGFALPDDLRVADFSVPRLEGARKACADLGLDEPLVATVPLGIPGAAKAVTAWVENDPRVSAVCAYNDEVAFAVLAGMRQRGLRAPGDIAVIGVDDIPTAGLADPPLTTVEMDGAAVGRHIAGCVVAALTDKAKPRSLPATAIRVQRRDSV